jgi:hypothetical protein
LEEEEEEEATEENRGRRKVEMNERRRGEEGMMGFWGIGYCRDWSSSPLLLPLCRLPISWPPPPPLFALFALDANLRSFGVDRSNFGRLELEEPNGEGRMAAGTAQWKSIGQIQPKKKHERKLGE